MNPENTPHVEARGLVKEFPIRQGILSRRKWNRVVDDVSFSIHRGRTLALVGESGSGKSTVGLMMLGLLPARTVRYCSPAGACLAGAAANGWSYAGRCRSFFKIPTLR